MEPLTDDTILPHLTTRRLGRRILAYRNAGSTNDIALDEGAKSVENPDGTLVVAEYQTRGRGRFQRAWVAPPSANLLFSLIVSPLDALEHPSLLTLAMGVSVVTAIQQATGLSPRLKWPNDVTLNGRKVCGILTESGKRPSLSPNATKKWQPFWVVGVGVNANMEIQDFPPEIAATATSLCRETGESVIREVLLARILGDFERWYDSIRVGDAASLLDAVTQRMDTLGTAVRVRLGDEMVEGIASGLDEDGALCVRTAWGRVYRVTAVEGTLV